MIKLKVSVNDDMFRAHCNDVGSLQKALRIQWQMLFLLKAVLCNYIFAINVVDNSAYKSVVLYIVVKNLGVLNGFIVQKTIKVIFVLLSAMVKIISSI